MTQVWSEAVLCIYSITKEANPKHWINNFADDQSLSHEKEEQLQEHITNLNTACERYYMKISIRKTEVMKVCRTPGDLNIV